MCDFVAIRTRTIEYEPRDLDTSEATAPDHTDARKLKELATVLAFPFAILERRMIFEAVWPERSKIHRLAPAFKEGSLYRS